MTLALTLCPSRTPQAACRRGLAALAVLFLVCSTGEVAAARGGGPTHALPPIAELQPAGWQGYKRAERHHHRRHGLPPRYRHHRWHGHYGRPHRGPGHFVQVCRPVTAVGWHHGRRALFGRLLCRNGFGQQFYLRGSQYLIRYLHR